MRNRKRNIVYSSTDDDFEDKTPIHRSETAVPQTMAPHDQTIRIQREKKGRRGKQVTVLRDFQLSAGDLEKLAKLLKKACGSGGTIKESGVLEIQGDHREKIASLLQKQGFKTKFVGG